MCAHVLVVWFIEAWRDNEEWEWKKGKLHWMGVGHMWWSLRKENRARCEAILKCNFNNISAFIFFFSFLKTLYNSFKMGLSLEKNALNRTMVYFALNLGLL